MTFDDWEATYRPQKNPVESSAPFDDCMLETYGDELAYVATVLKDRPGCVWTVVDCDDSLVVTNGAQFVNRLGYLVTEHPFVPTDDAPFLEVVDL